MNVAVAVPAALKMHPSIRTVRIVGSRTDRRAHEFSDWDFAVETGDFESVARGLHGLVAPLRSLAEQWDPYSSHACYMLMLPGPTKIDLLFPEEHRNWSPPWDPSPETLEAIDRHFWDWIVWLEQKRSGGAKDVLAKGVSDMYELMLQPLGVAAEPQSVSEGIDTYMNARNDLEQKFGVSVPRDLEHEVRPAVLQRQPVDANSLT